MTPQEVLRKHFTEWGFDEPSEEAVLVAYTLDAAGYVIVPKEPLADYWCTAHHRVMLAGESQCSTRKDIARSLSALPPTVPTVEIASCTPHRLHLGEPAGGDS